VEGVIETEGGEEISIKLLDTDSVTQAKEKVLDALYRNTPASKRPQLTSVDLGEGWMGNWSLIGMTLCMCASYLPLTLSPSPPFFPSPPPLPRHHAELRRATAGIILRDQDQTNIKDGDWIKVNTLGHYKLDEMVCRGIPLVTIAHSTVKCPGFEP